jgi:hypothetical protein
LGYSGSRQLSPRSPAMLAILVSCPTKTTNIEPGGVASLPRPVIAKTRWLMRLSP